MDHQPTDYSRHGNEGLINPNKLPIDVSNLELLFNSSPDWVFKDEVIDEFLRANDDST
ncbi:MAG: hypothetical protein AAB459_00475 [Patescibacteria group bacterium]